MKKIDNELAKVFYNKKITALDVVFHAYVSYDEFVKILKYEFEIIRFFSIKKCIVDLRKMKVYAVGTKEFVADTWFPQIIKLGVKCVAFIIPENIFAKISMETAHEEVNKKTPIDVKYFKTKDEGIEWIKNYKIY